MIFKPKIKKVLQTLSMITIAIVCALTINTLQTHASDIDQSELNAFLGTTSSADSTSQNQQGGNKTIKYGVHPTKTGYIAYLLTADGQRASSKAVAFKSPGFSYYPGNVTWKTQSRLGNYSVSSFGGDPAPWDLTPWQSDGKTSNEPNIKAWMLTKEGGEENTLIFIKDREILAISINDIVGDKIHIHRQIVEEFDVSDLNNIKSNGFVLVEYTKSDDGDRWLPLTKKKRL